MHFLCWNVYFSLFTPLSNSQAGHWVSFKTKVAYILVLHVQNVEVIFFLSVSSSYIQVIVNEKSLHYSSHILCISCVEMWCFHCLHLWAIAKLVNELDLKWRLRISILMLYRMSSLTWWLLSWLRYCTTWPV